MAKGECSLGAYKVIGVRTGKDVIRYAVLEAEGGAIIWLNHSAEHKWLVPKAAIENHEQLRSAFEEFSRILELYGPVRCVAIKIPEYNHHFDSATSMTIAMAAAVSLAAALKNTPVEELLYATLKLNTGSVEQSVLSRLPKTDKYWDVKMQEALAAALRTLDKLCNR